MDYIRYLTKEAVDPVRLAIAAQMRKTIAESRQSDIANQEMDQILSTYDISKGSPTARGIGGSVLGGTGGAGIGALLGAAFKKPGLGAAIGGTLGAGGGGFVGAKSPSWAKETLGDWAAGDNMLTFPRDQPEGTDVISGDPSASFTFLNESPVGSNARRLLRRINRE